MEGHDSSYWHGHSEDGIILGSVSICKRSSKKPLTWLPTLGHLFGNSGIGAFNLLICRARVGEFITAVGIVEVARDACHVCWDLKISVFLSSNLGRRKESKYKWVIAFCESDEITES